MNNDSPAPLSADTTLMGQLIAELAKFGGMDKKQASQLAQILLPLIEGHYARKQVSLSADSLRKQIIEFQKDTLHEWETGLKNVGMIKLAYRFADEMQVAIDAAIRADRERLLETVISKADTYALRQTIADEGKDGIRVIAAVPVAAVRAILIPPTQGDLEDRSDAQAQLNQVDNLSAESAPKGGER